jgi:hypothetical protein
MAGAEMSIAAFIPIIGQILDRILPDKQASEAAKLKLFELTQAGQLAELDADVKLKLAAAGIVQAEAASGNLLTSAWRPILMLTFGALIVARFLGWTAPGITEVEYVKLWDIVQLGLGGYVIGRSVEQTARVIAPILKR